MMWLLEMALIGLLSATLFHAMRLERALGVLKRDRSALEDLVAGFNSSTRAAEQGIERLRSAADGAGRQIARQTETAAGLKDDLLFLIERGERLADRMDALVRAARASAPDPPRIEVHRPVRLRAEPAVVERMAGAYPEPLPSEINEPMPAKLLPDTDPPHHEQAPKLRSQAERDLLRALRVAR